MVKTARHQTVRCKSMVSLLALAHGRGCEAELAAALTEQMTGPEAGNGIDVPALQAKFAPVSVDAIHYIVRTAGEAAGLGDAMGDARPAKPANSANRWGAAGPGLD